ncbi:MAG: hypothetical protein KAS32_12890 [Candidatus Peribacteraceae bacterium]|nr:hypothetical protein [Candidatus Peribacteraceae bacterium]
MKEKEGSLLLILSGPDALLARNATERAKFLDAIAVLSSRIRIATKERKIIVDARKRGIRVIERIADLKNILGSNRATDEAIRLFSPAVWQQRLRNNLQSMGLLSLPKLRVWILIIFSLFLFFFVLFRLLPSSEVTVKPKGETITHTANIFLVSSGSSVDIPQRVRTIELIPIHYSIDKTITFDQISKEFIGENATTLLTVINNSEESYSLRKRTRAMNHAGMIFRLQEPVNIHSGERKIVKAAADNEDIYGEIIGDRGNVPAGLHWNFPGLTPEEQLLIFAENEQLAIGGVTEYRKVLHSDDLVVAKALLEQELLAEAKQLVDEHKEVYNSTHEDEYMEILYYDELTISQYNNIQLPDQFLGQYVASVPITGTIEYIAYAYDSQAILNMLSSELRTHVEDGKRLLGETISMERLITHVIDYSDDLSWIKLTVDLSGTEEYILDPLSPNGAKFGKKARDMILGKDKDVALRILKNLPEVEDASISIWPPWNNQLPSIPSHISIDVEL